VGLHRASALHSQWDFIIIIIIIIIITNQSINQA